MNAKRKSRRPGNPRLAAILAVLVLTAGIAAGGTVAYLIDKTDSVENRFTPSAAAVEIEENFDGTVKKNVTAKNTGDIPAYIRILLVTYRVNEAGDRIGGAAAIPPFNPGTGWLEKDGYYYYSKPVAPGKTPEAPLIGEDGILLTEYEDADGGRQVVEVIAQAIQAEPEEAVMDAWGFVPGRD